MAKLVWAAGYFWTAALFVVLLYKRRYKTVPWFTAWIGLGLADNVLLVLAYRLGSKHLYAGMYWGVAFFDLLLQIAVVFEIAGAAMRRSGRWVEGTRIRLVLLGAIAPLFAFGLAWFMTPAAETRLDAWDARANLFITALICVLFSGVVTVLQQLSLGWRNHIMREGYGLMVWTVVSFLTDTLHSYWRTMGNYSALEYARIGIFQAVSLYWIVAFWFPELEPVRASQEDINRLKAIHSHLP